MANDLNSGQPEQIQQVARAGLEDCKSDALTTKKEKEKYFSSDIDDSHRNCQKGLKMCSVLYSLRLSMPLMSENKLKVIIKYLADMK